MYAAHNWEKIPQQVQTQLPSKPKTVSQIFISFLKYTWNFAHLEKKDQPTRSNIWEFIDPQNCVYLNAKKYVFQNTLRESTRPRVSNTAPIFVASLLS